jgi:hypothetical protein
VHPKDLRDKANHAALRKVLEYYGQDWLNAWKS